MTKKIMALTVSTAILANSFQMALANPSQQRMSHQQLIQLDEKALEELLNSADQKTLEELKLALESIVKLKTDLKSLSEQNEQDLVLRYANKLQVILIALTSYTMHSQFKNQQTNNTLLALATASAAVNTFLRHYQDGKVKDAKSIAELLFETSQELSKQKELTPEMQDMINSLNDISKQLIENQSMFEEVIKQLGGGSDMVLVASFGYLLLHWLAPKLAKESDGVLKKMLPQLKEIADKLVEIGRRPITAGAASAGLPDIISITLGLSSDKSEKLILQTLINLDIAANKIKSEIKVREDARVEQALQRVKSIK